MALKLLLAAIAGCAFTEVVGYWLHILLHSEKVAWLSRGHMIHHLKIYGPRRSLRHSTTYQNSVEGVEGRYGILGIGLEWTLPIGLLVLALIALFTFGFGWSPAVQAAFLVPAMAWGYFVFGTMHSSMHVQDYWMASVPLLGAWYRGVRRRHDIHHMRFTDDGRMPSNFGICFHGFDFLFGTYAGKVEPFNRAGYEAALERYAAVIR
jgi:sterol desaturase/sphingolipid hydroxylase (fatty acid hydroxylase superfamily)